MLSESIIKKYRKLLLEVVLIVVVVVLIQWWQQRDMISGTAPDFQSRLLSGENFQLHQSAQKPLLLHFWAEWCPVCRLEESSIQNLARDYHVVTVAMQSGSDEEVRYYLEEKGLSFSVINDDSGVLSSRYAVKGVPASFIIDRHNQLRYVSVGYTTELGLRARLWLAE